MPTASIAVRIRAAEQLRVLFMWRVRGSLLTRWKGSLPWRMPIVALNASDDLWAPPASRDAFMVACRHATVHGLALQPASLGLAAIGHMGCFRATARPLWNDMLARLQGRVPPGRHLPAR